VTAERAWTRWGELLDRLRANAPDLEWTFPTGHIHRSEPPPALGHGSSPTNVANPPVRPLASDEQIAADLDRRKHRIARDRANRLALHRQRLNAPSVIEHELYLAMHLSDPTIGPDS
jgi:hypothetical protein